MSIKIEVVAIMKFMNSLPKKSSRRLAQKEANNISLSLVTLITCLTVALKKSAGKAVDVPEACLMKVHTLVHDFLHLFNIYDTKHSLKKPRMEGLVSNFFNRL